MVKKTAFILSIASIAYLEAAEFTASVNDTKVLYNESFSLNLSLKDASPKETPLLAPLKKHFTIHSQQQSTNTTILNGKTTSSITWKFSLSPKTDGVVEIPSISIHTTEGLLSSEPISLNVVKCFDPQSKKEAKEIQISTKASNTAPYKNEPFTYTVLLTSKTQLFNVQTQKMQVEDAIVEFLEQPKLEEKVVDGKILHIVEFTYLITPLKTGPLTIEPIAIQGATPKKRKGHFSSLFNEDIDPFSFMQGVDRLEPFTLISEEATFDIQNPVPDITPWIAAKSLKIEEQFQAETLTVGEPISRTFTIQGEGLKVSQLPSVEDLQNLNGLFKIYADKPEEQEKAVRGTVHSTRKEHYTLIPSQAGTMELPEIAIAWWDTLKKEKRITKIPARTVQVLPSKQTISTPAQETVSTSNVTTQEIVREEKTPLFLYVIISALTLLLTASLVWGFTLQRKLRLLTKNTSPKLEKPKPTQTPKKPAPAPTPVPKEKKEKLPGLNPT